MISMLSVVCFSALILALVPALLLRENLRLFRQPADVDVPGAWPAISVLIPARDEQAGIAASVSAVLASRCVDLEVLVLDDHSADATAEIVLTLARSDARVRLIRGPELPPGWCGKQHACWVLAHEARHPLLVFIDADVRLSPDALARIAAFLDASGADLASGFPRQETVGVLEKLVIPLMHFILLGFLPVERMRRSGDPAYAAGCGQLFISRREAYDRAGGHAVIRETLHDGLRLPRAYRLAGLRTDLFDATEIAVCRMYRSAEAVWSGLAKNAVEGLGSPRLILPMTAILLGGQVLPIVLVAAGLAAFPGPWDLSALGWSFGALAASYYSRWKAAIRFRQSLLGALLHPLGVLVLVSIQWFALARGLSGRPSAWKGRLYRASHAVETSSQELTS